VQILSQNFQNKQFRTIILDDQPFFVVNDIANILELSNGRKAVADLFTRYEKAGINSEGVTRSYSLQTNGGKQELLIISEVGLYELIFASRKEEAIMFRHWVTNKVLPSIRKTGNYSISQQPQTQNLQIPEIRNSTEQIIELDKYFVATINLLKNLREQNPIDLYRFDKYILENKKFSPLAHFKIDLENQFFLPTELGKMINKSPVEINLMLEHKGFQVRENGVWKMTSSGNEFGISIVGKYHQIKWKIKTVL